MDQKNKNLSVCQEGSIPNAEAMRFSIVVAEWNPEITDKLLEGAKGTLLKFGANVENILEYSVPGSFELTAGAAMVINAHNPDVVICLGCVIQGETRHFEFICQAVSQGLTHLSIASGIPVIFGVLTTDNYAQALDRAGGKHGNKGDEAAITAIKMANLKNRLSTS